ncbi:TLD-domain-containing protein [Phycomyces nitens]|nr:TLD-domain-containing protein [Phycomyces nitens]
MFSPPWTPKQALSECTSISSASSVSDSLNLHEHSTVQKVPCLPPINLEHRDSQTYACLDKTLAENLRSHMPSRIAASTQWELLYSLDQHGASLNTFYSRIKEKGPCILILENSEEEIFGAYISEPFQSGSLYYGSGECFLWRIEPNCQSVQVYPWTMANNYLIFSNQDCIALGGGNGQFGLWINSDLMHGHTEPCATFGNPPLGNSSKFECVALEMWGFRF